MKKILSITPLVCLWLAIGCYTQDKDGIVFEKDILIHKAEVCVIYKGKDLGDVWGNAEIRYSMPDASGDEELYMENYLYTNGLKLNNLNYECELVTLRTPHGTDSYQLDITSISKEMSCPQSEEYSGELVGVPKEKLLDSQASKYLESFIAEPGSAFTCKAKYYPYYADKYGEQGTFKVRPQYSDRAQQYLDKRDIPVKLENTQFKIPVLRYFSDGKTQGNFQLKGRLKSLKQLDATTYKVEILFDADDQRSGIIYETYFAVEYLIEYLRGYENELFSKECDAISGEYCIEAVNGNREKGKESEKNFLDKSKDGETKAVNV